MRDLDKKRAIHREYMAKRREAAAAIRVMGGDQHQPIALARPRQSVAELRAELEKLGPRPSHKDILTLTSWVERRDRLVYLMVLAS